jgi:hypothetical protein
VVLFTFALARDLLVQQGWSLQAARWVAMVASLLAATSGQLWQWSISVMADTSALFWATLAAWTLVRYATSRRAGWLLLAGFALAWAVMTRWIYGLLVIPFGVYWVLAVYRPTTDQRPTTDEEVGGHEAAPSTQNSQLTTHNSQLSARHSSLAIGHLLLAALVGLVVLTPQIILSAAFPQPVLGHQWLVGWSPLNALRSQFTTVEGYAAYPLPVALFYAKAAASPRYLFPLFTPCLLLGLGMTIWRRQWLVAALVVGWGAIGYGFLIGIPSQNFRFTLILLPAVVVLSAIGLRLVWEWLAPRWRWLLLVYLLIGLAGGVWYSSRTLDEFIDRKEADLALVRWVEGQVPAGDRLLTFGLTLNLQHYTNLDVHELFYLTPADLPRLLADSRPTYVLVAVDNLEHQWRGLAPERAYSWLRDGPGLVSLDTRSGYTLFRVRG